MVVLAYEVLLFGMLGAAGWFALYVIYRTLKD